MGISIPVGQSFTLGGIAVNDTLISTDSASTSDTVIATAGYIDANSGGSGSSLMAPIRCYRSTNVTPTSRTVTTMDFDTKETDPDSRVTTGASWTFTAPTAGLYRFTICFLWDTDSAAAGFPNWIRLARSGRVIGYPFYTEDLDYFNNAILTGTIVAVMSAGEAPFVQYYCGSTNPAAVVAGSQNTWIAIEQIA